MLSVGVSCIAERVQIDSEDVRHNEVFKYVEHGHQGSHFDCRSAQGLVLRSQTPLLRDFSP